MTNLRKTGAHPTLAPMRAWRGDPGQRWAMALLAWLGGIALQLQQPALWPAWSHAALIGAGLVGGALAWVWRTRCFGQALLCAALATIAFAVSAWRADARLSERLAAPLEQRDLVVIGTIDRMPLV